MVTMSMDHTNYPIFLLNKILSQRIEGRWGENHCFLASWISPLYNLSTQAMTSALGQVPLCVPLACSISLPEGSCALYIFTKGLLFLLSLIYSFLISGTMPRGVTGVEPSWDCRWNHNYLMSWRLEFVLKAAPDSIDFVMFLYKIH